MTTGFGKWGYVGWFPSEAVLTIAYPADKCRGNWASVGSGETLTFYYSNGYIWSPGGGSLGWRTIPPYVSTTELAHSLSQTGTQVASDSPAGRGLCFELPPGLISCGEIILIPSHSMVGVSSGTTNLVFAKHKTVTQETGVIKVADQKYSKRGFSGRGNFKRFNIDGARDSADITAFPVHGIYYSTPTDKASDPNQSNGGDVHYMEEVVIGKCTGSGVYVNGRDQFSGVRMRSNDNARYGYELIDMNDSKMFAPGANGNLLGALYLEHTATPKFYGCDFGNPNSGYIGTWTVTMVNQARALFDGGEIQGRVGILGRNDNASNQWEMTGNVFHGVNFKIDGHLTQSYTYGGNTISAQVYAEDIDGLSFSSCKLQYNDNIPVDEVTVGGDKPLANTPDYFLHILGTSAGLSGAVKFTNMAGLAHRRSRPGDALPPMVCFKKHYSNAPWLIEWDFAPGELEYIPWSADAAKRPRNFVPTDAVGIAYNKADYPFGYLWAGLATFTKLDDVATTFTTPAQPSVPAAGMVWAMRVWP